MYGSIYGMKVVSAPMAREVRDEYRVERHPTKKRRKQWRVVKHRIDRPCFYRAGDTLFVHPELIAKLKIAVPNAELSGPRPLAAEGSRSNDVLDAGG